MFGTLFCIVGQGFGMERAYMRLERPVLVKKFRITSLRKTVFSLQQHQKSIFSRRWKASFVDARLFILYEIYECKKCEEHKFICNEKKPMSKRDSKILVTTSVAHTHLTNGLNYTVSNGITDCSRSTFISFFLLLYFESMRWLRQV